MNAVPAPKTKQERSAESSRRMLDAAISLIAEKGFERTTAVEIGERAGFSRELVRRRYGSKEALLEQLLETEYKPRLLGGRFDPDASGLERVTGLADRLIAQAREESDLLRAFFVLCFEAPGPVQAIRAWLMDWLDRYQAAVGDAISAGQRDGSIRAELDPDAEARSLMADGVGRAYRWVLAPADTDFVGDLIEWRERFVRALTPPAP